MKWIKRILLTLLILIIVSATGGYFYFKDKFLGAPPSQLTVTPTSQSVDFIWRGMDINGVYEENIAMYVPITIPGVDRVFYMQFDTGAHSTVLYLSKVQSINEKFGDVFQLDTVDNILRVNDVDINVGTADIHANFLTFRGRGNPIDWEDTTAIIKLGTIGSDFIEKHMVTMDFKNQSITLAESQPIDVLGDENLPMTFEGRKVFLSAVLNDEPASLWYDSGSSAFELIVAESTFEDLATPGSERTTFEGNSWGDGVVIHNAPSSGRFEFGDIEVPLTYVTFIEWPNKLQAFMLKASNIGGDLGGMTGNKLFLDKVLILDTPNLSYRVEE